MYKIPNLRFGIKKKAKTAFSRTYIKKRQPFSKISGKKTDEENFKNFHNNTGLDSL